MLASPRELTFESFGVPIRVLTGRAEDLERVVPLLPPGSRPDPSRTPAATFSLLRDADSGYELYRDEERIVSPIPLEDALGVLEREFRRTVSREAPAHVFVHAGVVAHAGAAALVPGATHSGKTSLVAAMVRAGAEYYSDEFAPLDESGLVHPFAKPLSIRDEKWMQVDHQVEALGGTAGDRPVPVGLVVVGEYQRGAEWRPRRLSPGEAVLALLAHTVPAQSRPTDSLRTISRALEGATVLEGARGEADALAPALLAALERAG